MKKLLKYCEIEEDYEDKSDLSTKLQVKTFEQLEQILFNFLRLIYDCLYEGET